MNPGRNIYEIREKLEGLLDEVCPIIDPKDKIFSFENVLECNLFEERFNKNKKLKIVEEPIYKIYYLIALTYSIEKDTVEAIKYFHKAIWSNPFYSNSYFELANIHSIENEHNLLLETLFELYKYIYTPEDLSLFYIILGDHYYFMKQYDLANILYSYSTYFHENAYTEKMLTQIGMNLSRNLILNTKEQCLIILNKNNIPTEALKENINILYNLYKCLLDVPEEYKFYPGLSAR